jgi:hypothetical protein
MKRFLIYIYMTILIGEYMKITRRQLRRLIMEAAKDIVPDDSGHAFAKHNIDPELEAYFDLADEFLFFDENAAAAAKEQGLNPQKLNSIMQSYQGRDEEGRFIHNDPSYRRTGSSQEDQLARNKRRLRKQQLGYGMDAPRGERAEPRAGELEDLYSDSPESLSRIKRGLDPVSRFDK